MSEQERGPKRNATYALDPMRLSLILYRLASHFLASPGLADRNEQDAGCAFHGLLSQHEPGEIVHLLIEAATLVRVGQDIDMHRRVDDEAVDDEDEALYFAVGTIAEPDDGDEKPMSLRIACNKIIHAEVVNFDTDRSAVTNAEYLNPTIYLYGTTQNGKKKWRAVLDVMKFVEVAYQMMV